MQSNNKFVNCPLVSVLIPAFNRESYIRDCIQSALNQTWTNVEVVISDNASTDGTWRICQEFANSDPRVRIFRNETNIGPVRNWERCIAEARGSYGKILFSDDLMAPEFVEKALPWIQDEGVGFVFSSIDVGEHPGSGAEPYKWRRSSGTWPGSTFIRESLLGAKVPVSPGAAFFRMADLRNNLKLEIPTPAGIDFTRYGAGPDVLLYLLTAASYPRIAYLVEPLCFFRSHLGSITVKEDGGMISEHYFEAKLWFSETAPWSSSGLFGSLRQQCLVYGWLMQRRRHDHETLIEYCRRHGESAKTPSRLVIWGVHLYRMKLRLQKSFWRILDRITA